MGTAANPALTAPKRPLSPFIFFSQEQRRKLKRENPELHSSKISKLVQHQWKQMSRDEKARYMLQSQQNRHQYEEQRTNYESQKKLLSSTKNSPQELHALQSIKERREKKQREKQEAEANRQPDTPSLVASRPRQAKVPSPSGQTKTKRGRPPKKQK